MLKLNLFLPVIIPAIFSCSSSHFEQAPLRRSNASATSYKWEQVLPFGNGSFQEEWKHGTFPLGITPIVAFNGNLWMIGQKSSWYSTDGLKWNNINKNDWGERISLTYAYFQNKLWMFGGMKYKERILLNEVWNSADGGNWQLVKQRAEWRPRKGTTVVVYKNKLWLFGGATAVDKDIMPSEFINDVWSSEDGIHWTEVTKNAPWPPCDNPQVVVFHDTLYMIGGQALADVWYTLDGKKWELVSKNADWKMRYDYGALVYDNKLWVFGGRDISADRNKGAKNDVWFSDNGLKWTLHEEHAPWTVRSAANSVVYKNKIWIYSGKHTGGKYNWGGDIWTMSLTR